MKIIKRYLLWILAAVSFGIFVFLFAYTGKLAAREDTQTMAERWSRKNDMAQVSCFFSINSALSKDRIEEFEHQLDEKLEGESITAESYGLKEGETRNEGARLWADAYSAGGEISISNDTKNIRVQALGVGGDFFLFHPLRLLSGGFFSGNSLMSDYVVLDEDAAWQLFGSNNVAGQIVTISGQPHIVTGVIERPKGRLYEAAGLSESMVYVSYDTLLKYASVNYGYGENVINHYEIVMPNPVKEYALGVIRENFGTDKINVEIVENTSRFSFVAMFKNLMAFGTRSMNGKAIIYPYWENVARGYEDIISLLVLFMILFGFFPLVVLVTVLVRLWKNKGWTVKEKLFGLKDRMERLLERRRANGKKKIKKGI